MELTIYAIPALIALAVKVGVYVYVRPNALRNRQTRLFLLLLIALSIHNLSELTYFLTVDGQKPEAPAGGYAVFGAGIMGLAFALHLALLLARDWPPHQRRYLYLLYAPAAVLEFLLWSTPSLVAGFEPVNYTYQRVPGSLYFLFEYYVLGYSWAVIALLAFGAFRQNTGVKRLKNRLMVIALVPTGLLVTAVITIQHVGLKTFNATFTLPLAITFFILVAAYATHQYRLFDITFYVPGSKVRARKTAFYRRIRTLIAEIADLDSVNAAVNRLADTLQCPVSLIGGKKSVLAAGEARYMTEFPQTELRESKQIVVADEIADTQPQTHALMRRHGIAAIVPFSRPTSRNASGWLLLGNTFSEQVYSSLDFHLVEQLFDKMAELFVDKLLTVRSQLAGTNRQIHVLRGQQQTLAMRLARLTGENRKLRDLNTRLLKEQPGDSLGPAEAALDAPLAATITLLGRDKTLRTQLHQHFSQLQHFVGPDSGGFRRQTTPDILVVAPEGPAQRANRRHLLKLISERRTQLAVVLYGPHAREFTVTHRKTLLGGLADWAPQQIAPEALARKIRALNRLRKAAHGLADPENPLLGDSPVFSALLRETRRLAGFVEPVWIQATDPGQAIAIAACLHQLGRPRGRFVVVQPKGQDEHTLQRVLFGSQGLITTCAEGTLMVTNVAALPLSVQRELVQLRAARTPPRLVVASTVLPRQAVAQGTCLAELAQCAQPFTLYLPALKDRGGDLPLLIHYFTLQFNLQAAAHIFLTQAEVDDMLIGMVLHTVAGLKQAVFERLNTKLSQVTQTPETAVSPLTPEPNDDASLDDLVSTFESRIIEQTLERCDGNKSKAARLLGLRANTLHYKLQRHRSPGKKKQ